MGGTGCDIVALNAINVNRSRQSRFYSKIIVDSEKSFYDKALSVVMPLEHFVWLAWSVKESVYKFLQRHDPELVFSPSKIILQQLNVPEKAGLLAELEGLGFDNDAVYSGLAEFGQKGFYSRSVIDDNFIFTAVNDSNDFSRLYWGIRRIGSSETDAQSAEVRKFILDKLNRLFPGEELRIEKSAHGSPLLLSGDKELPVTISFAHHHRWVAYSFVLNN
ncbi:4'-phosphopantetheinyl transferase superfamily protein [Mucilaginibacter ginsenosidivorans]|uniref:4'-phosphopantetheinyl transferase superfamily protein n=1 Tax=Mucilaginibacter ginsenosidivorans TaxID=398053 RepID=A0A5B8UTG5_9SPHI|nr:4'-phosphopantetheinyl transferase superfamily protein [Mucilaginibacter ginsenosidivorans]QEC62233.1 4'-phosphopantetheinyl transferase superfamily protein [Mucilaginibacter ginsenosidivorans]